MAFLMYFSNRNWIRKYYRQNPSLKLLFGAIGPGDRSRVYGQKKNNNNKTSTRRYRTVKNLKCSLDVNTDNIYIIPNSLWIIFTVHVNMTIFLFYYTIISSPGPVRPY